MSEDDRLWTHIYDLRVIIDELFSLAAPGTLKNALWRRYQSITSENVLPPDLVARMRAKRGDLDNEESNE